MPQNTPTRENTLILWQGGLEEEERESPEHIFA